MALLDPDSGDSLVLKLAFRPPLAAGALWRFFGDRAVPGVEAMCRDRYVRSVRLDNDSGCGVIEARFETAQLVVRVRCEGTPPLFALSDRLRRLFDLEADPGAIEAVLARDAALAPRVAALPGIRVPGAWDGFETAVRAILGQQVRVAAATRLARELVLRFGERLPETLATPEITHLFPDAETLAGADLGALPMPRGRIRALAALAREVAEGRLCLAPSADLEIARAGLLALPGVGAWTADYIAMRVLRNPDAFPSSDLGLRRATNLDARALADRALAWRPWRAYAALLLWSLPTAQPPATRSIASSSTSKSSGAFGGTPGGGDGP